MDEASSLARRRDGMRRRQWQIYFRDGPPLNFDGHSNDRALISGNKSRLYHPFSGEQDSSKDEKKNQEEQSSRENIAFLGVQ